MIGLSMKRKRKRTLTMEIVFLVYEFIKLIDGEAQDLIEQNLNIIEFALEGETEFTAEDIELLRYYFKQRPDMSDYEVDELSDRAIELAWKAEQYKVGKL
jgi:hypothetical protein